MGFNINDIVKKSLIAPYIRTDDGGPNVAEDQRTWKRIMFSTAFSLSMNAETKTYSYISSDTDEEEVVSYKPSLNQSIVMHKGSDDYEYFFDMLFRRPVGSDAHKDVLIVFYQERLKDTDPLCQKETGDSGAETSIPTWKAWEVDSVVKLNTLNTVDQTIEVDLSFNSIKEGVMSVKGGKEVFTKAPKPADE